MSNDLESSLSPMGHHAIDKDAAIMMRMNKAMMSTLPASSFLPCLFLSLLLFSFPLATRSAKTWVSFLGLHCKEYAYRMTIGERKVVSYLGHMSGHRRAPTRGGVIIHPTPQIRSAFASAGFAVAFPHGGDVSLLPRPGFSFLADVSGGHQPRPPQSVPLLLAYWPPEYDVVGRRHEEPRLG